MKHTALILAALLLPSLAFADDSECTQWCKPYWKSMPKLEYVYFVVEAADCSTTLDIKNQRNADGTWRLEEKNPLLGNHPSDAKVIGYCTGTALLHSAITYEMVDQGVPRPIITAWELISIGVETGFAAHNYSLGLRFKF